jgi:hypothetical protein
MHLAAGHVEPVDWHFDDLRADMSKGDQKFDIEPIDRHFNDFRAGYVSGQQEARRRMRIPLHEVRSGSLRSIGALSA